MFRRVTFISRQNDMHFMHNYSNNSYIISCAPHITAIHTNGYNAKLYFVFTYYNFKKVEKTP